jgi:hypothetical protein
MARNLTRNTKVYISTQSVLGSCTNLNTWEVKVLDGYNFSQATTTEDITIDEAGTTPIRGQKTYNVAVEPVDISMTTYIRPYDNSTPLVDAPERILWASLAGSAFVIDGNGNMIDTTPGNGNSVLQTLTDMTVDFEESDANELAKVYIWFHLQNATYRVDEVNISTAEIDFSITDIASIAWSGMGTSITELSSADHTTMAGWTAGTEYTGVPTTTSDSFLRNKLSTMTLYNSRLADNLATGADDTGGSATLVQDTGGFTGIDYTGDWVYILELDDWRQISTNTDNALTVSPAFDSTITAADTYYVVQGYNIAITGGTMSIENNMNFLTPEELGTVNQPLPGFAQSRAVTGNITAYLNTGTRGSAQLLADLLGDINSVSNTYGLSVAVGGSGSAKKIELKLDTAQLAIPTINVEDVIATDIAFAGQGSDDVIENQDEVVVIYTA